ncbi:MAG: ABC transporter ATP-binding protein [Candidatus Omnitrophica bacterium]|nr:ABC transporter ATP-binding protein [Candidatus Omnitrophota bacterium]MCM8768225.1 ABC transporter ATP-binding protein [Candidatus Omnitrophota bacterium]
MLLGEGLSKVYGKLVALREVTIEVARGEIVVVLGPSGSGKTTLLNLLALLDRPSSGKVFLNGEEISRLPDTSAARLRNQHFGFVFQFFHLLPELTVWENVFLPLWIKYGSGGQVKTYRQEAENLLTKFALTHRKDAYPRHLSGGEMQRVAICRSLVCHPQIILADEPTGALDRQAAQSLVETIVRLNQEEKVTFLIATHNEMFLQIATKVVYLKDGRIEKTERISQPSTGE